MRRRAFLVGALSLPLLAGKSGTRDDGAPDALELPVATMRRVNPTLWIAPLASDIWISCFTARLAAGWYPANGLIIAHKDGATLIDTGWSRAQGEALLRVAGEITGQPVRQAIATHFHSDRLGGIEAFRRAGVPVLAHPLTSGLARAYGTAEPDPLAGLEKGPMTIGGVELVFPGAGHSRDNITAWHAPSRTLFGGCLVKSTTSTDLGNLEDADRDGWNTALAALEKRYPARQFTITGHGSIAGDPIAHSRRLVAMRRG